MGEAMRVRTLGRLPVGVSSSDGLCLGFDFLRDGLVYAAASVPAFAVSGARGRDLVAGSLVAGFSVAFAQVFFGSRVLGAPGSFTAGSFKVPSSQSQPQIEADVIEGEVVDSLPQGAAGWVRR